MSRINRRDFMRLVGGAGAASALGVLGHVPVARGKSGGQVVVIGGGFGGATCAKYLRKADPGIAVTLVERDPRFITCPFSNLVLGGLRTMDSITHGYDALRTRHGVNVVKDEVTAIDPVGKKVTLKSGKTLKYDRLVVSPGIDFKWGAIKGYDPKAAQVMPHAWKAGPQTVLLRKQLEAMKDGGTFILATPPNPFRCPPGPYERVSMVAHYLKASKPKSKILILDNNDKFSKQGLFQKGWEELYPGMVEWVAGSKGGVVKAVDTKTMIVKGELDDHKGAVVNIIPAQTAGQLAIKAGLTNETGWCPVDPKTFESTIHPGVHVIGDSSIAGELPKSGFAANSEAKICANAIVAMFRGDSVADASYVNTCYSLLAPDYGISVAAVYRVTDKGITSVEGAGGVSPADASRGFRQDEAKYAVGWYQSITADIWA
ncbi:MAG TPA: FCSD flavin-binding domain-containing protein [Acidiferrobacterales bacterium]